MRLFAAVLPPPGPVVATLADEVAALRRLPGAQALRWTDPSGWHFTLAFYGEVDDGVVPELSARLARAAGRTPPFALAVRGGGQFGHGRALWAGAEGDLAVLRRLAERAEAAGRRAAGAGQGEHGGHREHGERGQHRRYRPHVTLARSRGGVLDVGEYVAALAGFGGPEWTVLDLALVRSNPPARGVPGARPRYEVVGRWALGGGG
ncbi:RNA 2',3'-cyclic phosphodiesterase [Streptomyces sp. NPDC004610]|uniref:RNA 2',3'-cyclic phosphodiesterase n=1 Tax=unclassified Streptomyces TaxID=2593676 RepID=UPI0033B0BEE4